MSSPTSGDGPKRKKPRSAIGRNPTRGYRGGGAPWWGYGAAALDGAPVFTWLDVPRMLRDPRVRFIERMWRAPFQKVKWTVKSDHPRVAKFVDVTLRKFWRGSLPKLLSRYWRYGFAPGGAEYVPHKGLWRLDQVRTVEPRDANPRIWTDGRHAGRFAGFSLSNNAVLAGGCRADDWVGPPHAFWFSGYGELSDLYDMPPISGLFEPWLEKRGRNGAVHSRRLYHRKYAYRGGTIRHPEGAINVGTDEEPQYRDAQDIARESLDYLEAGDTLTLSNEVHPAMGDRYAWEYEPADAPPDVPSIREYPKDLDGEMSEGAGLPPEVLEAADVGSGWSGRLIPLLAYLGTVDELAGLAVAAANSWLRPAAAINFGRDAWYEVETLSLADEVAQQQGKGGQNPIPGLFDGKPPTQDAGQQQQQQQRPPGAPLSLSVTIPDAPAAPHRYGCVYVPLPQDLADRVREMGRRIPEGDLADKGRDSEPHVTLRWGLETDAPDAVREVLADAPPPRVKVGGASAFTAAETGKGYDVVKLDVTSPDLRRLNRELAALPHHDEHPEYRPHVSVAFVKPGRGAEWAERLGRLDAEFTAEGALFSDRDKNRTAIAFAGGAKELSAVRAPAPPPLELSWSPYEGPKGGKGWVSDTGEVRYQTEKPADDEESGEKGPESLFAHPDFAHLPEHTSAAEPRDFATIRADAHAAAERAGLDPAELHRRAAGRLHQQLADVVSFDGYRSPARQLSHHEAQALVHRTEAERQLGLADTWQRSADEHRQKEAEFREQARQSPGIGWGAAADSRAGAAAESEKSAAEYRAKATAAAAREGEHQKAAAEIRAGRVPGVKTSNKRNLLAGAYKDAHQELAAEKGKRDDAAAFAGSYFEHDKPVRRAAKYLKGVDEGTLDADLLPDDTRAAVVEDLAQLPPAKLAAHVAHVATNHGPGTAEHDIAAAAARTFGAARPPKPLAFDGAEPGDFMVVTPDEAGEDLYEGLRAAAGILPSVKAPVDTDRAFVIAAGSPLAKIAADEHGTGKALDDWVAQHALFNALSTGFQLPQKDVPASAKDYGGTSGSRGSGEFQPEGDWNPHAVDVYRRVNADWYLKRPADGAADDPYEWVHRTDAPPLSRLPDAYWEHFDPEQEPQQDDDLAERAEKREHKSSGEGAAQKRDIGAWKQGIKEWQRDVGLLKQEWQQALKGVPEDERPDEPDWDDVDESPLTDQHDSREEHAAALEGLHGDYEQHVNGLRDAVEGAKAHAAEYHAGRGASRKAIAAERDRWHEHFKGVPEDERPDEPEWDNFTDDADGAEAAKEEVDAHLADHAPEHRAAIAELKPKIDAEDERHRQLIARDEAAQGRLDNDPPLADEINGAEAPAGSESSAPTPVEEGYWAIHRAAPAPDERGGKKFNALAKSLAEAIEDTGSADVPDPNDFDTGYEDTDLGDEREEIDPADYDSPREYAEALRERWQDGGANKIRLDRQEKVLERKEAAAHRPEYHAAAVKWAGEQAARYDEIARRAEALAKHKPAGEYEEGELADDRAQRAAALARAVAEKLRAAVAKYRDGGPKELSATRAGDYGAELWRMCDGPVYVELSTGGGSGGTHAPKGGVTIGGRRHDRRAAVRGRPVHPG